MTFMLDIYKDWDAERLKIRCRQLVRANVAKDMLICAMVEFGSIEALPKTVADEVREILSAYCDEDDRPLSRSNLRRVVGRKEG